MEAHMGHLYTQHMEEAPRVEDTRGQASGGAGVGGWPASLALGAHTGLPSPVGLQEPGGRVCG